MVYRVKMIPHSLGHQRCNSLVCRPQNIGIDESNAFAIVRRTVRASRPYDIEMMYGFLQLRMWPPLLPRVYSIFGLGVQCRLQ